jgi:hypothetical protein
MGTGQERFRSWGMNKYEQITKLAQAAMLIQEVMRECDQSIAECLEDIPDRLADISDEIEGIE